MKEVTKMMKNEYVLKIKDLNLDVSFIDTEDDDNIQVYLESMSENVFWDFIDLFDFNSIEVNNFQFTRWNIAGVMSNELNNFKISYVETERRSSFFIDEKDIEKVKSVEAKLYKVTYTQVTDLNLK
jgi:hypothetical protein